MRICHVAQGCIEIPPTRWGAVESVISDYGYFIQQFGHQFHVVNTNDIESARRQIEEIRPNVLHVHNENWHALLRDSPAPVNILTTHDGLLFEKSTNANRRRESIYEKGFNEGTFHVHCLSKAVQQYFLDIGLSRERLFFLQNGARSDLFRFTDTPRLPHRAICLARVSLRKRQRLLSDLECVDFVGPRSDPAFDYNIKRYLGEWTKAQLYSHLTDYACLVLLSASEAAPLATCEALMAGLGVVVSEASSANLDLNQPFVSVVPESKVRNTAFVLKTILQNQEAAVKMRREIRDYARANFDWRLIVEDYLKRLPILQPLRQGHSDGSFAPGICRRPDINSNQLNLPSLNYGTAQPNIQQP